MPTQQFKDKIGTKVSMALQKKKFCLPGAHSLWGAKPNDKWKADQMQLNVICTTKTLERGIK